MKTKTVSAIALSMLIASYPAAAGAQTTTATKAPPAERSGTNAEQSATANADSLIADWPAGPKLGARQMMAKYGTPDEATAERLIWKDEGPYRKITVTRMEIPHDFPQPHMDYMAHTIHYAVPADKADELAAFDGSVIVDRTAGEVTARCDLEGHNILTLNLMNDVVTGEKSVEEARQAFSEIVVQDMAGEQPRYVADLQFTPASTPDRADPDKPTITGAVQRPSGDTEAAAGSNAEILAFVAAIDESEIKAAKEAAKKDLSKPVADYATMLHKEHGRNLQKTMSVGQQADITPVETESVATFKMKNTDKLAELVPLKGKAFEAQYVQAMIDGHTEALAVIDSNLQKTDNQAVKTHLTETRQHVAMHLEQARKLQEGL